MWGIHRWPVNSPHKGPVMRKMFPFDDVIMITLEHSLSTHLATAAVGDACWTFVQCHQSCRTCPAHSALARRSRNLAVEDHWYHEAPWVRPITWKYRKNTLLTLSCWIYFFHPRPGGLLIRRAGYGGKVVHGMTLLGSLCVWVQPVRDDVTL